MTSEDPLDEGAVAFWLVDRSLEHLCELGIQLNELVVMGKLLDGREEIEREVLFGSHQRLKK